MKESRQKGRIHLVVGEAPPSLTHPDCDLHHHHHHHHNRHPPLPGMIGHLVSGAGVISPLQYPDQPAV